SDVSTLQSKSSGPEPPIDDGKKSPGTSKAGPILKSADGPAVASRNERLTATSPSTSRGNNLTSSQGLREVARFDTADHPVQAQILPDALHVLYETTGEESALWLGEVSDPKNTRKLNGHSPNWKHLVLSSDGRFAVTADDQDLRIWYLNTEKSE